MALIARAVTAIHLGFQAMPPLKLCGGDSIRQQLIIPSRTNRADGRVLANLPCGKLALGDSAIWKNPMPAKSSGYCRSRLTKARIRLRRRHRTRSLMLRNK
jgi:hypothetical protein